MIDWLDHADSVWLARDIWKDERRARLFSALAFNFGWLPEDAKIACPGLRIDSTFFLDVFLGIFLEHLSNFNLNATDPAQDPEE